MSETDFDPAAEGAQSGMTTGMRQVARALATVRVGRDAFDTPNEKSPARCTAKFTATSVNTPSGSAQTTRVVIAIVDQKDH